METRTFIVEQHDVLGLVEHSIELQTVSQDACATQSVRDAAVSQFVKQVRREFDVPCSLVLEVKHAGISWVEMAPELILQCHSGTPFTFFVHAFT